MPIANEGTKGAELLAAFVARGAARVDPGYLQPAELLLDLYGEDIRARAYRTDDPVLGEQMLRPDFTVPVVQAHMEGGRAEARYSYAGPVWRRQEYGSQRGHEFWQAGYEILGAKDRAAADADVFQTIADQLETQTVAAKTGDLSLIFAAIDALKTSDIRKAALRRHVWRPKRFQRLLERFAGHAPFDCDQRDPLPIEGNPVGLRTIQDVEARLTRLSENRGSAKISQEELAMIETILSLNGSATACLNGVTALGITFDALGASIDGLERRLEALEARDIDVSALAFEGAFGRHSMEYYDGFTFAFFRPDGEAMAQGGRYDALTAVLGHGPAIPAVGGVIRPGLMS